MPSIFCTGLAWWNTDEELLQAISPAKAELKFEEAKSNGKSKGNVEIIFASKEELEAGMEALKAAFENIKISLVSKPRPREVSVERSRDRSDPSRNLSRDNVQVSTRDYTSGRDRSRDRRDRSRDRSRDDYRGRRDKSRDDRRRRDYRDERDYHGDRDNRDKSRERSKDNVRESRGDRDRKISGDVTKRKDRQESHEERSTKNAKLASSGGELKPSPLTTNFDTIPDVEDFREREYEEPSSADFRSNR